MAECGFRTSESAIRSMQSEIEVGNMSQSTFKREVQSSFVGLPVSWYFDPEILEIERQHLFADGPKYGGHSSLVRSMVMRASESSR